MISDENVDDQNLLHNVVAVVLQLAQDVPSLRDEDCKDFLRILISWIISHFEAQQKKNIEKFCWMKYEKYQPAFGFDKWPVLPVHLVVETCGDIIQPYFPPPSPKHTMMMMKISNISYFLQTQVA